MISHQQRGGQPEDEKKNDFERQCQHQEIRMLITSNIIDSSTLVLLYSIVLHTSPLRLEHSGTLVFEYASTPLQFCSTII